MTVEELYGQMVDTFQRETGLALAGDGDMAVRLYAVAAQLYALYVQADWVGRQCFPQTAQGDYLDKHAQLRGLERRAATAAVGVLSFETDHPPEADLSIPEGTVCMTAAQVRFETTEAGVLKAGQTSAQVRARAVEPGAAGNAAAGTVRAMAVAPVGVSRCTNPEAFSGGLDAEGDESLRERVLETFRRMPNGANAAFTSRRPSPFRRWRRLPWWRGPGAWGRWTCFLPRRRVCPTADCWNRWRPIWRNAAKSPWMFR